MYEWPPLLLSNCALSVSVAALEALAEGVCVGGQYSKLQEVGRETESIFNFSKFNFQFQLLLYEPPECSSLPLIVHLKSVISQFTPISCQKWTSLPVDVPMVAHPA